ncbi:hypothetical protein [Limnohabitans sp.]
MTNSLKNSQAASKSGKNKLASSTTERWNKQELFKNFYVCTREAVSAWETYFDVTGLAEQVFSESTHAHQNAENVLRASDAWRQLLALLDYASEGVTDGMEEMSIVMDAAEILALIKTENYWPSQDWDNIVTMGDARYALGDGMPLDLERIALLANVDIRTVRNAASAGELSIVQAPKDDPFPRRTPMVDNASARRWLHGRKGFKPTVSDNSAENIALEDVRTAAEFGAFLKKQRERIGLAETGQKLTIFHPCATVGTIQQLEAGVFMLPLDAVFRVADFYQLSKKALLECVMRVFFTEELETLTEALKCGIPPNQ